MTTNIEISRKLAELLNDAGIEVEEKYYEYIGGFKREFIDVPLVENLMVLMDAGEQLGFNYEKEDGIYYVTEPTPHGHEMTLGCAVRCEHKDWKASLCSAYVEAIFKKLGAQHDHTT